MNKLTDDRLDDIRWRLLRGSGLDRETGEGVADYERALFIAGMEYAATYLDDQPVDRSALAKAIRTLADGEEPCEDCGYPMPSHDPSCVSRNLK